MSARRKRREEGANDRITLSDSLDPQLLRKLKETKRQLKTQAEKEKLKEEKRLKKEERERREKNKSFEQLLEENPLNWKDFK